MAASAWGIYSEAKKYLGGADIDLDGHVFKMMLLRSASNALTLTLSVRSELTNEISATGGYAVGGKSVQSVTWGAGASASEMRFDATALVFTASGASLTNVKFAVIYDATGASAGLHKVVCVSKLSTAQFTVTSPNTLTITPSANGFFELN